MTIWCMHVACWIPKATNTHSEYVMLIAFPLQQWLHEHASMLCYMYVPLHVYYSLCPFHFCHCSDRQKVDCFSVRHLLAPVWLYSLVTLYLRERYKYILELTRVPKDGKSSLIMYKTVICYVTVFKLSSYILNCWVDGGKKKIPYSAFYKWGHPVRESTI